MKTARLKAVDDVTLALTRNATYVLVGESGCGKTTVARLILLLATPTQGDILFDGVSLYPMRRETLRSYRRSVQCVFQDPYASLSPRMRVKDIIAEPLQVQERMTGGSANTRVAELLEIVGLDSTAESRYPHEFSGGQRQRIAIARALSIRPELLVLDEPFSALDVSIRAQIINLLATLREDLRLSYLVITHDLAVARHMGDRIGVMYLGRIVEEGPGESIYSAAKHPYTRLLLASIASPDLDAPEPPVRLDEDVPSPIDLPSGCRFHPRCPDQMAICRTVEPYWQEVAPDHYVACHLYQ